MRGSRDSGIFNSLGVISFAICFCIPYVCRCQMIRWQTYIKDIYPPSRIKLDAEKYDNFSTQKISLVIEISV